jgi:hypothetical protein
VADDDDENDEVADGASHASSQPEIPESKESSWLSSAMSSISQHGKKRKHNTGALHPTAVPSSQQKGSDFWSMVKKWFAAHMQPDQLGTSSNSPRWTKYVELVFVFIISDMNGM